MQEADEGDAVDGILAEWARERPDLDASPVAIVGRLHRVGDHVRRVLIAGYREHGLGEGEFDVLATLRRQGSPFALAPSRLAERTMVTTGGMTKRLDRLVAAGLVTRRPSGGDGRVRVVALTAEGVRVVDDALAAHLARERRLLASLDADDRDALARILRRWAIALGDR